MKIDVLADDKAASAVYDAALKEQIEFYKARMQQAQTWGYCTPIVCASCMSWGGNTFSVSGTISTGKPVNPNAPTLNDLMAMVIPDAELI